MCCQLSLELRDLCLLELEFIYPMFIGRKSSTAVDCLEKFDWSCFGVGGIPNVSVKCVEDKLREHLERLSLGDVSRSVEGDRVQGLDAVEAAFHRYY